MKIPNRFPSVVWMLWHIEEVWMTMLYVCAGCGGWAARCCQRTAPAARDWLRAKLAGEDEALGGGECENPNNTFIHSVYGNVIMSVKVTQEECWPEDKCFWQ